MKVDYNTEIGRCNCDYEGYMIKKKEYIDKDCSIDIFYCPKCKKEIGYI